MRLISKLQDREKNIRNKTDRKISNKRKLGYSVVMILIVVALIAGLSYAWFFNQTDMATLMSVKGPSDISILGPNGSNLTSLDLNYTKDNIDANKKVTIRRIICVQSASDKFQLEIVHTTNLKGLTFKLYPTTEQGNGTKEVVDGDQTCYYDPQTPVSGGYINQSEEKNSYKYATNAKHDRNYGTYSMVQSHAEPLYWKSENLVTNKTESVQVDNITKYRTYYVCEVTWTETTKETDIFYVLAKTVQ